MDKTNAMKVNVMLIEDKSSDLFDISVNNWFDLKQTFDEIVEKCRQKSGLKVDLKTHLIEIFDEKSNQFNEFDPKKSSIRESMIIKITKRLKTRSVYQSMSSKARRHPKTTVSPNPKTTVSPNPKTTVNPLTDEMIGCLIEEILKSKKDKEIDWQSVSQGMGVKGYLDCDLNKCQNLLRDLVAKYYEIFKGCDNYLKRRLLPSFGCLEAMDLKPYVNKTSAKQIKRFKDNLVIDPKVKIKTTKYEEKCHLLVQSISKSIVDSTIDWFNVLELMQSLGYRTVDEKELKSLFDKTIQSFITTKRGYKEFEMRFKQLSETPFRELNDFDFKAIIKPKMSRVLSEMKERLKLIQFKANDTNDCKPTANEHKLNTKMSNKSTNGLKLSDNKSKQGFSDKTLLNPKLSANEGNGRPESGHQNVEEKPKVKAFDHLVSKERDLCLTQSVAECLTDSNKSILLSEPKVFWQNVSELLESKSSSVKMASNDCKTRFYELIDKYMNVLKSTKTLSKARNDFFCLNAMNAIDLSLFLNPILNQLLICLKSKLVFNVPEVKAFDLNQNQTEDIPPKNLDSKESPKREQKWNRRKERPFEKMYVNYRPMHWKTKKYFNNLSFNPNFHQLLKTGSIDDNALQKQLLICKTIEEQIEVFRKRVLLNEEDFRKRNELTDVLQEILEESGIKCEFHFFGSTANSVGFRDSDIDLFLEIEDLNNFLTKIDFNQTMSYLTEIRNIIKNSLIFYIPKPIASLRCPIIRVDFKLFRDKFQFNPRLRNFCESLETHGISCDINMSNALGLQNTRLIHLFCEVDHRFQELAIILRFFAKKNGLIGGRDNAFTSYAFTQLVIFFCQNLSPPLLPTVDQLRQLTTKSMVIDGWESSFCDDSKMIPKSDNKESVFELLPKFFKYYSEFDFTTQVIQLKSGKSVHKCQLNEEIRTSLNTQSSDVLYFKMTSFCCIQDPFNMEHNLTSNLSFAVFDKFVEYLKQIAFNSDLFFCKSPPKVLDKDWGLSTIIRKFSPSNNYHSIAGLKVCLPNPRLCVKSAEITAQSVIKLFANDICDTIPSLLKNIYQISAELIAKYDIILGEFSPFAEFTVSLKALDLQIIDLNNRELIRSEFKDTLDPKKRLINEKIITEEIINRFRDKPLPDLSISSVFVLYCYARPSGAYIHYEIVESKSELKLIKGFLNSLFDSLPKIIEENYEKE